MVRVARGSVEDLDRIEALWHALHRHDRGVSAVPLQADDATSWRVRRSFYEAHLSSGAGVLFIAMGQDGPIGYAFALLNDAPDDTWGFSRGWSEIYSLVVAEEARSAGVGTLLLDAVTADARERGFDGLSVATMTGNESAVRFYQRHGFQPAEVLMIRMDER